MSRMNKAPDPSALLAFATGAGESMAEMRAKVEQEPPRVEPPRAEPREPEGPEEAETGSASGRGRSGSSPSKTKTRRSRKSAKKTESASAARAEAVETGKIPKIPKNFRIRQDLAERIEAIVAVSEMNQTDLLESALEAFLDEMEARYEERTGQEVPRAKVVRLLD